MGSRVDRSVEQKCLRPSLRLDGFPFHLRDSQFWMGDQQMPDHRLKRLGVGSDGGWIHNRNEYTGIRYLRSETSVATHNSTNNSSDLLSVLQRTHEIGADVRFGVAAAN